MPAYIVDEIAAGGQATQRSFGALEGEVVARSDVLYVTRVQKERFASDDEYARLKDAYVVTPATLRGAKPAGAMVVMHPLPRVGEISPDCDDDPRAAYFRQMRYGLFVRMALLALTCGVGAGAVRAAADAACA